MYLGGSVLSLEGLSDLEPSNEPETMPELFAMKFLIGCNSLTFVPPENSFVSIGIIDRERVNIPHCTFRHLYIAALSEALGPVGTRLSPSNFTARSCVEASESMTHGKSEARTISPQNTDQTRLKHKLTTLNWGGFPKLVVPF